jgi:hypothetical protein
VQRFRQLSRGLQTRLSGPPNEFLRAGSAVVRNSGSTECIFKKYPAAQKLQERICRFVFIDEMEKSGFIQRLYVGTAKP